MKLFQSDMQAKRLINVLLFAFATLAMLLPFFTITLAGKTYAYSAVSLLAKKSASAVLLAAPLGGLLVAVMPKVQNAKKNIVFCLLNILGIAVILFAKPLVFEYGNRFSEYALGSFLSMAIFAVGILYNAVRLIKK